ncbi:MAG: exopolysaccharide biosynthesis polyprenyl glycosylphosphotransferase [Novosphingobium sp.]|nr:exopolysaccharide biosynthesis polyprenyl glycosylphosphotransferase [Novosphingobium sp.]MCP5404052.1 exopolysaccharide biosynthesis polyprenyl glycosylphosphotransferase [Novosphingobium sp.]
MTAYFDKRDSQASRYRSVALPPTRENRSRQSMKLVVRGELALLDVVILGLTLITCITAIASQPVELQSAPWAPLVLLILPFYVAAAFNGGAYSDDAILNPLSSIICSAKALSVAVLLVLLVAFALHRSDEVPRSAFLISVVCSGLALAAARTVYTVRARRLSGGRLINELLILDGLKFRAAQADFVFDAESNGLIPDAKDPVMLHRFGTLTKTFDRVVIACSEARREQWTVLLKGAEATGEILAPNFNELGAIGIGNFCGYDTFQVSRKTLGLRARAKKRLFDLAIAIPALIALLPLFILVAFAIKLESRGPVFFRQQRVGRGNRFFDVLKFRSMYVDLCDRNGSVSTQRGDPRVTRVGRFLRSTSIDELPQLINVLLSEMSIVGPRPHALGSLAEERLFWEIDTRYWYRHRLKPGITGLAQVRGFRGATETELDLVNRLQSDLEYIQDWRIWRDVGILIRTLGVFIHRNAF